MNGRIKKTLRGILVSIIILIVLLILVFLIFFLGCEKRINENSSINTDVQSALSCASGSTEEAFFSIDGASQVKHVVKILLINDSVSKVFYMYEGKLKDADSAKASVVSMDLKLGSYLHEKGHDSPRKIESTFNHIKNEVRIDLYADRDGLNKDTATLFFLGGEEIDKLLVAGHNELRDYYVGKGFICDDHD